MKHQNVMINGITITIPDYYKRVDSMPDDPMNSIPYMAQTNNAMCFALIFPVDESKSLPRTKESLLSGIRQFLGKNQGLIQVEVTEDHVYRKDSKRAQRCSIYSDLSAVSTGVHSEHSGFF